MPTKIPSTDTDGTEYSSPQPVKKKMPRGRLSTTRSHNRPKRNASMPDKHDAAPLLADYASSETSKTAAPLPPISLGYNKNKSKTKQAQLGGKKGKRLICTQSQRQLIGKGQNTH
jgi:hypothetical protein